MVFSQSDLLLEDILGDWDCWVESSSYYVTEMVKGIKSSIHYDKDTGEIALYKGRVKVVNTEDHIYTTVFSSNIPDSMYKRDEDMVIMGVLTKEEYNLPTHRFYANHIFHPWLEYKWSFFMSSSFFYENKILSLPLVSYGYSLPQDHKELISSKGRASRVNPHMQMKGITFNSLKRPYRSFVKKH